MAKANHARRPAGGAKPGAGASQRPSPGKAGTQVTQRPAQTPTPAVPAAAGQTANGAVPVRRAATTSARTSIQRNRRRQRIPWWRTQGAFIGTLVTIALIVALFVLLAHNSQGGTALQPAPPQVVNEVTQVSPAVFAKVGAGDALVAKPVEATNGHPPILKDASGKPIVIYVGAEWCPFCAAQRWSLITALGRFGTFANVHLVASSSTDTYPDTPTFSLRGASYTSRYIVLSSVEVADRTQQPLTSPDALQQKAIDTYDVVPYTQPNNEKGIPFTDIADLYVAPYSGFVPDLMQGETQQSIADKLSDPADPLTQRIVGNANYLTAAICVATNNQPASVCAAAPIPQIQKALPKGQ
jgi:thiol-disulfide isomerase/thioredoxin